MQLSEINNYTTFQNLELLAKQVVEGFITGMHKSPFHGFSVEFAEHRLYNKGESTKHIDWKLFAKTDKLFIKRYEEETNLRCQIIIDNSASMYFPDSNNSKITKLNKIGFSVMATASLIEILKRQRDAFGLALYANQIDYFATAKGSERHKRMLFEQLQNLLQKKSTKTTKTFQVLHEIAERIHRRSLIFLFTDMLQADKNNDDLFEALRHLKYNKHEVILFHTFDKKLEYNFDFDQKPKKFIDVETKEEINLFADGIKNNYNKAIEKYFNDLKLKCMQYKIDYVPVDINLGFDQILTAYLLKRQRFL